MNRYVKKPIAIEAVKWKGFNNDEIKDFAGDSVKIEVIREGDDDNGIPPSVDCSIETLEGVMIANVGDYIIKGVNGEFYPCKPDIFEKTYLHEDMIGNISDGYHTGSLPPYYNHHTIPLSSCYYPYHHNQDELDPLLHKVCQVSY